MATARSACATSDEARRVWIAKAAAPTAAPTARRAAVAGGDARRSAVEYDASAAVPTSDAARSSQL